MAWVKVSERKLRIILSGIALHQSFFDSFAVRTIAFLIVLDVAKRMFGAHLVAGQHNNMAACER